MYPQINYPKTSCACGNCCVHNCDSVSHDSTVSIPNNIFRKYCTTNELFNVKLQPKCQVCQVDMNGSTVCPNKNCGTHCTSSYDTNSDYLLLNKLGLELDSKNYYPVRFNDDIGFVGNNPLLVNAAAAQRIILDRPNYTRQIRVGDVPHDEIYTPEYSTYGRGYKDYNSVNTGDVQYYIDMSMAQPYFYPNYVTPNLVSYINKTDPMSNVKPQYDRTPLVPYQWDNCRKDACYSSTHDALQFRQDIMERQQRKMNQNRYENIYPKGSYYTENIL